MNKSKRNHQNNREEPRREKKKKKQNKTKRERRSRLEIGVGGFKPLCATQVDPGRTRPKLEAHMPGSAWVAAT